MTGLDPTTSSNDNMTIMYGKETSILSLQKAGKRKTENCKRSKKYQCATCLLSLTERKADK